MAGEGSWIAKAERFFDGIPSELRAAVARWVQTHYGRPMTGAERVQRHRNEHRNEIVTSPSNANVTPSVTDPPLKPPVVSSVVPASNLPETTTTLSEHDRKFLEALPETYRSSWLDVEWWTSLTDAYDKLDIQTEISKYLAHQGSLPASEKHKNVRRGLRNWLATADRWRTREAERKAARGERWAGSDRR